MNRDIKFRAWDKENEVMIPWARDMFSDSSRVTSWGNDFPSEEDGILLMQFTGMQDSKGTDIYEGDVLRRLGDGHPFRVIFLDGAFRINWPNCCENCACGESSTETLKEYLSGPFPTTVIANVFQNPDWIKKD